MEKGINLRPSERSWGNGTVNPENFLDSKMNSSIIYRDVTVADAQPMIEYLNQVAGETVNLSFGRGEYTKSKEEEEAFIQDHLEADNQLFIVAEDNGHIVGHITISANQKIKMRHIGVIGISIRKPYWRKGIGRELMGKAIAWAHDSGVIRKLNLNVLVSNIGAIALYQDVGFEIEGRLRRDMFLNGEFTDALEMGMLIN